MTIVKLIILFLILTFSVIKAEEKIYTLTSPDGSIKIEISVNEFITYSASYNDKQLISSSKIFMKIDDGLFLGKNPEIINDETKEVNEILKPVVKVKSAIIEDRYKMLRINFKGDYSLIFRLYNDGVAYRFVTSIDKNIKVNEENIEFNFAEDFNIYFPEEESFFTHMERIYIYQKISEVDSPKESSGTNKFCSIPALVDCGNEVKIAITEADLFDYPGFYLTNSDAPLKLKTIFPGYPLEVNQTSDRDVQVTKYADYLAETTGKREFPWRVLIITDDDKKLIESQMIYKLASPSKIGNTDWIKPGKVAWDWWNAWNIYGVDFKAGINTETYKYYIDFASEHGIEYVILDEGWYKFGNLFDLNPDINLKEIIEYGKKKNVGIILWVIWKTLDDQFDKAFEMFEELGIKGIKVDFMQRDDQLLVQYYEKVAKEAAKRNLLVDFHGAYKPTGLIRTYPNVISSEGVRGNEWNKWSEFITPEHTVTLPFTRMLAGPMDFTPGAMLNGTKDNFKVMFDRPMSQGTRCHQLAMYVVYESPLQMLCDNPSNYLKEKECLDFLSIVPTVWDTTIVLDAKVADYVLIARRNGEDWYIGGMTDWTSRDLEVDFSFLPKGKYTIEYYKDGINANRYAGDYKKVKAEINSSNKIEIHLAPGGGWAARIY
ncbi:MAG: alpha-glucosidase [Ignavibacteria bacterium GWA2_35_9]|nr:MAG: alpha-glucosidase [Ignavibacteria bacterium GWA2_35_9]OGU52860.1 MAG: alpha-glucosidase [Ignavibacteria bacterium GWC2_36_12]